MASLKGGVPGGVEKRGSGANWGEIEKRRIESAASGCEMRAILEVQLASTEGT